jgi:hypothetical protein
LAIADEGMSCRWVIIHLVGGLEPWNFMTFHILGMSSSQLKNSYFSEG